MNDDDAKGPVACLDSGTIVALTVADDMHHDGAVRTCKAAMERGNCQLVTSPLAIMEAAGAIRKKITRSHRLRSGSEEEQANVNADAGRATALMFMYIDTMVKRGDLKILDLRGWSPDFVRPSAKVREHAGRAVYSEGGRFYRYRGVGSCDWLQFELAEYADASVICTTDAAFADIEGNDEDFGHIRIQMTNGPLIGPLIGDE